MTDVIDWTLIDRFLAGHCSEDEAQAARAWLKQNPESEEFLQAVTAGLGKAGSPGMREQFPAFDPKMSWTGVEARLAPETTTGTATETAQRRSGRSRALAGRWRMGIPLAGGALALAGVFWMSRMSSSPQSRSTAPLMQDVRTAEGERASVSLPDGSKVTLGVASHLRYLDRFSNGARKVVLDGEAVFTVTQHTDVPFIVEVGGITTRVLGTTFNVRKYDSDSTVRVTVAEGKVDVANTILTSGDQVVIDKRGETTLTRDVNVASTLSWTTGRLTLSSLTFRDAIPELERWYGIKIEVADAQLLSKSIRLVLEQETAADAADLIAFLVHAKVERTGQTFVFRPIH